MNQHNSILTAVCSPPDPARSPARSVLSKSSPHPPSKYAPAEMPPVSEAVREPSSRELAPRSREHKRSVSSWCPCARSERSRAEASLRGTARLVRVRVVTLAVIAVSYTVPAVASPRSNGVCGMKSLEVLAEVAEDPKFRPSLSTIFWQGLPGLCASVTVLCTVNCLCCRHCLHCKSNYTLVHN